MRDARLLARRQILVRSAFILSISCCVFIATACGGDDDAPFRQPTAESICQWTAYSGNPLIEPPRGEVLIADPTVVHPRESPDGRWHLFANSLFGIHHYVSGDGLSWETEAESVVSMGAVRPFVFVEGDSFYLFYEQYHGMTESDIQVIESVDLVTWSDPQAVLLSDLDWEQGANSRVGNPFVAKRDGEYLLYYSAGGVRLDDASIYEPHYMGLARASSLGGPWTKEAEPILGPSDEDAWRNRGAGSMKLLDAKVDGQWIAFNNGIYETVDGVTGSAIRVLVSEDGKSWEPLCDEPIIAPSHAGWDAAFIYAFDIVADEGKLLLYYNARDGWLDGWERIGLAVSYNPGG